MNHNISGIKYAKVSDRIGHINFISNSVTYIKFSGMGQWGIDKTLGAHTEGNGSQSWNSLKGFKGGTEQTGCGN